VLVGWQPIGRRCSWWPTGAAPASLIPVVAVVFICGLSDVLINEYLFYLLFTLDLLSRTESTDTDSIRTFDVNYAPRKNNKCYDVLRVCCAQSRTGGVLGAVPSAAV